MSWCWTLIDIRHTIEHFQVWSAFRSCTDDLEKPIHEMDVLAGHENDVNYVQFRFVCSAWHGIWNYKFYWHVYFFIMQWVCCGFKVFAVWLFEGGEFSKVEEFLVFLYLSSPMFPVVKLSTFCASPCFYVLFSISYISFLFYSSLVCPMLILSGFVMII